MTKNSFKLLDNFTVEQKNINNVENYVENTQKKRK